MQKMIEQSSFSGGFSEPAFDAAYGFRAAMRAMARPGERQEIGGAVPPAGVSVAAGSLLLTLCDPETAIYLTSEFDTPALREWISFHTGAPVVAPEWADFALGGWEALAPFERFRMGTAEYPDRSCTLIVEMPFGEAPNVTLRGPGIKDSRDVFLPEIAQFQRNASNYPQGLDFFFTSGSELMALPRSTTITARG